MVISPLPQRQTLLALLDTAVAVSHPDACLPPHLPAAPAQGRILVLGAGKGAAAMARAAERHYAAQGQIDRLSGFITTRHGYGVATERIEVVEAGHPVPDAAGFRAAARALGLAEAAAPDDLVLVLLAGGASALWSAPVEGLDLATKQAVTRALLRSGAPIGEMNIVRRHISRIKGGRLARAAMSGYQGGGDQPRLITLAISDVPGDDPEAIGSGPTVADPTTLEQAREVIARRGIDVPEAVARALADPANETPKPRDPIFTATRYQLVARPQIALAAAAEQARSLGYRPILLGDAIEGEAREVAGAHAQIAREARLKGERIALLSGGELTVTVRGNGSGGPNQEYALALALALEGTAGIVAIAADTDGTDGGTGKPDDPMGALIDATTLARAAALGMNAATFLDNNDSSGFFAATGDLIVRGATQTNVNDFRAILIDP